MLSNIIRAALLCGLAGPAIGCFYVGVLSGRPLFVVAVDIGGVPVYVYALITAGPFGLVIGAVGGFFSAWLVRMGWTRLGLVRWLAVHGTIGTFLVALFPLTLMLRAGADSGVWRWTAVTLLTGATCGALVGYLAWRRNPN